MLSFSSRSSQSPSSFHPPSVGSSPQTPSKVSMLLNLSPCKLSVLEVAPAFISITSVTVESFPSIAYSTPPFTGLLLLSILPPLLLPQVLFQVN